MVEPFDYHHKDGNSGVFLDNNAELGSYTATVFNGGQRPDTLVAVPRYVGAEGLRLGLMQWIVTAAGDADIRVGIYSATSMKNLYPAGLVIDCGVQSLASGGRTTWNVNTVFPQGVIWLAWLASTANGQVISPLQSLVKPAPFTFLGKGAPIGSQHYVGLTVAQAYGALPATFPAGGALLLSATSPIIPHWFNEVF